MKLLSLPLKKAVPSPKVQKNTGIVLGALFAASLVCLAYYKNISVILAAFVGAAAVFAHIWFKLYRLMWNNPLIYHLICALGAAYLGSNVIGIADAPQMDKVLLTIASGAVFSFFILELICGIFLKFAMDKPEPKNFLKAFAVVFSLLFTCFVYLPSETYINNSANYRYVYLDFAPYIFIRTIVFSLLAAVAACALKKAVFRVVCCIGAGLTLCTYCQYMFMNKDLPLAIDDPIDWESLKTKAVINALVWVGLFLLPLAFMLITSRIKAVKNNKAVRNAPVCVSALIGAVQVLSLAIMLFTTSSELFGSRLCLLSNKEQFVVSSKKNVITFILDMSDRHYFDDAYKSNPEKFEFLKDFTYYTNAAMVYDSTNLSIPQMLSGYTEIPKDNGFYEWMENAWKSDTCETFYKRLHDNDYKVNVFGSFGNTYQYLDGKVDNCEEIDRDDIYIIKNDLYESINDMAAFRYLPIGLKKHYEPDMNSVNYAVDMPNSCIMDNNEYAQEMNLKKSDSDKNYFIVEHLYGSHYTDKEAGTQSSLDALKKYTDQLKKLGVYDDAVIIITADHGTHGEPDNFPIWYIKRANEHNDQMQYNNAPICFTDYLATCLDTAGLKQDGDEELFGRSIYQIKEDEQRERLLFERNGFKFTGEINGKKWNEMFKKGNFYGYYFTGDREALKERTESGPPDIYIALNYEC
ncbi:MAG: hypothetical protein IJ172_12800 [Ruminococcus sp.]|nr:hypothetical protein [Ruminococcus sp.]